MEHRIHRKHGSGAVHAGCLSTCVIDKRKPSLLNLCLAPVLSGEDQVYPVVSL